MNDREEIRALLIEDDEEDTAIFGRYIGQVRSYAVTVLRAETEEEAERTLAGEVFDVIFLDLNLGGRRSGLDFLRRLNDEGVDAPIVIVTGSGDEEKAVRAMKYGASDYLVKDSLSPELLERSIRSVREKHALQQEMGRMVRKLADVSVTDELTSIANRRHLMERLREEVDRSARTGHTFALIMIDLDHFKGVNDLHGHQVGDDVLKRFASALRENFRSTDLVGRYGGEEFCVLLPYTPLADARRVAEKLRAVAKTLPEPMPTVSVGVACWEPQSTVESILHRADEALYRAKEGGRDRVVA